MANIITRIALEGGDEIKLQLTGIGEAGTLAFKRLKTAADGVNLNNVTKGSEQFATAGQRAGVLAQNVKDLQESVGKLTDTFPRLIQAAGRFSQRLAIVGTTAVAAGIGLAVAAKNIAKQVDGQSDSLEKQTQAQIDSNNAALSGRLAQISYQASLRKLTQQLLAGEITNDNYNKSVKQLNLDFAEQQRVANQVAAAQDSVKDANERLQKQLKDRQAFTQLADTFGGPLLSSLTAFGRQIEQIRVAFVQNFGPAAAKLVDTIASVVAKNSDAITTFFKTAGDKITALLATNGPQIEKFLTNIGSAVGSIFNGFIQAAPAIIDFFNNQIVPAISRVAGFFNALATAVNAVFGTNLTGGSIVIVAILAQMTGSIRIVLALTRTLGASWKAFGGVISSIGAVFNTIFGGGKIAANIIKIGTSLATSGGLFKTFLTVIRSAIPLIGTLATIVASALGVSFGAALVIVLALAAAFTFLLTKVDWTAFLAAAKQAITDAIATLQTWLQAAKDIIAAVIKFFVDGWAAINQGATDAAKGVTDTWQAIVKFFSDTWDSISQGASDMVDAVVQFFTDGFASATQLVQEWFDSVVGFFNNIIDKAKAVGSAIAGAFGGGPDTAAAPQSNAEGGAIRGRGTGTSDSILSWLSNGEYVLKAKAVSKYGLQFLNAVNQGKLNLKGLAGFAGGGVVSMAHSLLTPQIPRFAGGGFVNAPSTVISGGRPFVLQIGDTAFSGLSANEGAVHALQRYAAGKSSRSAGRKPLWYRD